MIPPIEDVDSSFTKLWSNRKEMECGDLFLNAELTDDVFFNKLANITCISTKMIDEAIQEFKKNNSKPFVYSLNYSELESFLLRKGFLYFDTQHVLKKKQKATRKTNVKKISPPESKIWATVFCRAYDCMNWIEPVTTMVKNSVSFADYCVDTSDSSCMVLYEKNSILGLYCLGTVPNMRKHGLASSLIDYALSEVERRNLDFLMLETYERDNLLDFYDKLDFERMYKKLVFTI